MEKFTASQVRRAAEYPYVLSMNNDMLHAYADRLEADEKEVPFGYAYRYWDGIRFDTGGREINGSKPTATIPLYTHPAPADAERLAEALERTVRHRAAADGIDPDQWRSVLYGWEDRALATHSAQAQPAAARVSDEMVERARSAFVKVDDGSTGITEAIRAALLAAQENPNGL